MCGGWPALHLGEQAFCDNKDCNVLYWNPTKTLDENLSDVGFVQLKIRCTDPELEYCPDPGNCMMGPQPHRWSTDCEMNEGWDMTV